MIRRGSKRKREVCVCVRVACLCGEGSGAANNPAQLIVALVCVSAVAVVWVLTCCLCPTDCPSVWAGRLTACLPDRLGAGLSASAIPVCGVRTLRRKGAGWRRRRGGAILVWHGHRTRTRAVAWQCVAPMSLVGRALPFRRTAAWAQGAYCMLLAGPVPGPVVPGPLVPGPLLTRTTALTALNTFCREP